jgi:hypothetical protein
MGKYFLEGLGQLLDVKNHEPSAEGKFVNDPGSCAWLCNENAVTLAPPIALERSTDRGWSNAIPTQIRIREEEDEVVVGRFRDDLVRR